MLRHQHTAMILIVALFLALPASTWAQKRILYVDSYHQGYHWSDGITRGIHEGLGYVVNEDSGVVDDTHSKVELKIHRMDTKRCSTLQIPPDASDEKIKAAEDKFRQQAGDQAKAVIDAWSPDLVIVSDDNGAKFLIERYYKNTKIPFVFCGLNWDASIYGLPCSNVTGMVEVALIPQVLAALKPHAQGERIGFIGGNTITDWKDIENIKKHFQLSLDVVKADTFADWKQGFSRLQEETDMVVLNTTSGIKEFDMEQAAAYALEHTKVPTGCILITETPLASIGYTKLPSEQGLWAAQTALKILDGTPPDEIPVAANERGRIYINVPIAHKLKIRFPYALVKQAHLIEDQPKMAAR